MDSRSLKIYLPFDGFENDNSIKGLKCEICQKFFFNEVEFKTHLRIHNGERPFQCNYPGCYRKFNRYKNMLKHEEISHKSKKDNDDFLQGVKDYLTKIKRKRDPQEETIEKGEKDPKAKKQKYQMKVYSHNPLYCTITRKFNDSDDFYLCGILTSALPKKKE